MKYLKRQERPVLPLDIETAIGIGHHQLLNDLEEFAEADYEVEVHPYLGVRLLDIPDRFLVHEIVEGLNTKIVANAIRTLDSCTSTNDEAWSLIESGEAKDGDLVIAERQSSGRGRMGRSWETLPGSAITMSMIFQVKLPEDKVHYITSAMALAIANTIQQFVHLPARIKWPNDVLIGDKKVCGILVESRSNHPNTYVAGIGINVNQRREDFGESVRDIATSLRIEMGGRRYHRIRLLRPILFYIDSVYGQLKKKKFDRIERAWKDFIDVENVNVLVQTGATELRGTALTLGLEEGLTLRLEDGTSKVIRPEHITAIRPLSA